LAGFAVSTEGLQVPIFADNVLPGLPYEAQLDVQAKAYERLDKSTVARNFWLAFLARKPA
jgi:hypothetical protein